MTKFDRWITMFTGRTLWPAKGGDEMEVKKEKTSVITEAVLKAAELLSKVPDEKKESVAITLNSFADGLWAGMELQKRVAV